MRILLAATAVAATLLGPKAVSAADITKEVTVERVRLGDVSSRDPAAVEAAYARLQRSAAFVCGVGLSNDRQGRAAERACADRALSQAVASANRPALTARHEGGGHQFAITN